jgi:ubiquitin-protein ligase
MVEKIRIHVIDRDGRFEADPIVPVNTTMREFIRSMGKKFQLPPEGPITSGKKQGNFRYYQPINKRTGQILRGAGTDPKVGLEKSFAELGVRDGDVIKITEVIVGGADRMRLLEDYKGLREIERKAVKYLTLNPMGDPPYYYEVKIEGIPGISHIVDGMPMITTGHTMIIDLRGNYPEDKPDIRFTTPIFHPYVYQNNKVCVTDGWSSAFPLAELVIEIIDRIQCKSPVFPKTVAIPANESAFRWYTLNQDLITQLIQPVPFPPDNGEGSPSYTLRHSEIIDWAVPSPTATQRYERRDEVQW